MARYAIKLLRNRLEETVVLVDEKGRNLAQEKALAMAKANELVWNPTTQTDSSEVHSYKKIETFTAFRKRCEHWGPNLGPRAFDHVRKDKTCCTNFFSDTCNCCEDDCPSYPLRAKEL